MFDAHCHLDFSSFDDERDALIQRAREAGVHGFIVAGVDPDGWERQRRLVQEHADVYATFGLHPWVVSRWTDEQLGDALSRLSNTVEFAVGETGLDQSRHCPAGSLPIQEVAFRAQLALARERNLPVVLHILGAHGRAIEILESDGVGQAGGMVHSYSGSAELVPRYETLGLYISFAAGITRLNGHRARAAACVVSPDRLLVETDCPDQIPHGRAGERNLPEWLVDVVHALADARDETALAVGDRCAHNTRTLFGLGDASG